MLSAYLHLTLSVRATFQVRCHCLEVLELLSVTEEYVIFIELLVGCSRLLVSHIFLFCCYPPKELVHIASGVCRCFDAAEQVLAKVELANLFSVLLAGFDKLFGVLTICER